MNHPDEMDWRDAPRPLAATRTDLRPEPRPELRIVGEEPRPLREAPAFGTPLPTGTVPDKYRMAPPPGRPLAGASGTEGSNRGMAALSAAVPFMQKLLPLLDTEFVGAVANLLNSRPAHAAAGDVTPAQNQKSELEAQQQELRSQVVEQGVTLKRVEDQLETLREAGERNAFNQQEIVDDLKALGSKVNLFAILLSAMLVISFILNVVLFVRLKQLVP